MFVLMTLKAIPLDYVSQVVHADVNNKGGAHRIKPFEMLTNSNSIRVYCKTT